MWNYFELSDPSPPVLGTQVFHNFCICHSEYAVLEPLSRKKKPTKKNKENVKSEATITKALAPQPPAPESTALPTTASICHGSILLPLEEKETASLADSAAPAEEVHNEPEAKDASKRGKKKGRKERTLLPTSNSALQSRVQQLEVCKAISEKIFGHHVQKEDQAGELEKPFLETYQQEASKQNRIFEEEVKLFLGEKEATNLLQLEG